MNASLRLVLCFVLPVLFAPPLLAQEGSTTEERRRALLEGTHVLRHLLHRYQFSPLSSFEELEEDPRRTLLIVLGDLNPLAQVPHGLERFVRRGGALLAASDQPPEDRIASEQLRAVSGVWVNRATLINPRPPFRYREYSFCIRVMPVAHPTVPFFTGSGFPDPGDLRVYSNIPTTLRPGAFFPGKVRPQATLPERSFLRLGPMMHLLEEAPLFLVAGELQAGQVVVVADHSVFINEMMLPRDTGNFEFSSNILRWCQGTTPRDRVLFVEDGVIQTKFDIPLQSVHLPVEEVLKALFARRNEVLVAAEQTLARMEDDDAFNRVALQVLDRAGLFGSRGSRVLLLLATLAGISFFIYRLGVRARFRYDPSVPVLAPALGRLLPSHSLLAQRQKAVLAARNLREPASLLARRWFRSLGLDPASETPMPRWQAHGGWGGWWQRRQLFARLRRLWQLARGEGTERITPARLWALQRELELLDRSRQRGEWAVESDSRAWQR